MCTVARHQASPLNRKRQSQVQRQQEGPWPCCSGLTGLAVPEKRRSLLGAMGSAACAGARYSCEGVKTKPASHWLGSSTGFPERGVTPLPVTVYASAERATPARPTNRSALHICMHKPQALQYNVSLVCFKVLRRHLFLVAAFHTAWSTLSAMGRHMRQHARLLQPCACIMALLPSKAARHGPRPCAPTFKRSSRARPTATTLALAPHHRNSSQ